MFCLRIKCLLINLLEENIPPKGVIDFKKFKVYISYGKNEKFVIDYTYTYVCVCVYFKSKVFVIFIQFCVITDFQSNIFYKLKLFFFSFGKLRSKPNKRRTKTTLPSQHFDLVVQRVFFAFQRFFVDDLHRVHLVRPLFADGQTDLGKGTPANTIIG